MPPRHQAAARGRGREVALPLSPEAVAAQRCAHWVAAAVRAAEDPEQALGALHAARRQLTPLTDDEADGAPARACVELLSRAISALYLYDVCAGESLAHGQGRGLFTHAQLCMLKAQLVLARCLAVRSPRLPPLALAQTGLAHVQEALAVREPARQKPARSRSRAPPRDAKPAARAPPAAAERSARRKGTRVGRRVTIVRVPQIALLPPALTAAELPPAALLAVANAVARVNAATAACGAEAVEAAAAVACRAGRRAERVERLIADATAAGLSDEQRLALAVQAKQLQLAPVQARIRAQVEVGARGIDSAALQHTQPAPLAEHAARAKRAPAVPAAELARAAAAHGARCAKADAARRSRNAGVLQAHAAIAAAAEARRAQARAERLAALKAHDYDAYLKLVRHGDTTQRIRSLLSRTDAYLSALGRKLTALRGGDGAGEAELPAAGMLRATLRPYQQAGVRWLVSLFRNGLNGCLADEMGLGKTVQVIALLCHLVEHEGLSRGPFLIVVPASVLPNWASELARWAPQLDVAAYTGPEAARTAVFNQKMSRGRFQICLTTFEMVMNAKDVPRLSRIKWSYLIMDEAHRIKNASCRLSRELEKYRFGRRLLLTGTPVQNNLGEMFTLLQFLMPTVFNTDAEEFIKLFDKPFDGDSAGQDGGGSALNEEERLLLTTRMHEALRPFMLRRVKEKVAADLPSKREVLVPCAPSGYQEHLCRIVKDKAWSSVATAATAGAPKQRAVSVNNAIMELRVLCNHPFLSRLHDTAEEEALGPHPVSSLVRHCGKLETLDRMLPKLKAAGHRVLLFCTMTRLLDVMEEYLASRGFTYLRLDGTTGGAERGEVVREFQAQDSSAFVFLLSVRAGGFGLNLQSADTVIMFDTDWNPQVDAQAQARSHRIGQTKDVLVIRLETAGSIEEGVRAVAARKMEVAERAITGGFFDGGQTSEEDRNDFLQALLRANDAAGDAAKAAVPSDAALNALIARSDAERELFDREDASRAASEARYWARLLASAPPGSLPQQLPPRLAGPVEAAPIIDRMNARATAAAVAAAAETETLGRGARKRVQLNGYVEIGERAFTKLCEEGAVGGAELVPLHKPAPAEPKEAPEPQADEPDAADAAPQAADAEPAAAAAEPVAAEAAEAAAPAAAPTRKRPQSAEEAAEEAPPAKRPRCPPAAAPDAEGAGDAADAAAGPRTFDSWREVTLRQPSKLRLLKFYLVDSATRSEMLAVKGTEGAGRRFRFVITPAAAAAAPGAAATALHTRGEVETFLKALIAASGGAAADAPSREASAPADSPRVCGRKRLPEETADEPPAKRHESMPASPVVAEQEPPVDDDPLPPPADEPPSPPPAAEPAVVEDAAPPAVAEAADKPFATAADECAALIGQRVCRGWRIMLPDGRSAQRWLDGVIEAVLPATGELRIAYENGTNGTMSLQEAKELTGACAVEE